LKKNHPRPTIDSNGRVCMAKKSKSNFGVNFDFSLENQNFERNVNVKKLI